MPDDLLALVDAHHHVWDLARRPQDWLDEPVYASIRRTFTLADLHAAATRTITGRSLTASVVVQCVTSPEETEDLLAMAEREPRVGAVVGWADLTDPAVGDAVDRLRAGPGGHLLRSLADDLDALAGELADPTHTERATRLAARARAGAAIHGHRPKGGA